MSARRVTTHGRTCSTTHHKDTYPSRRQDTQQSIKLFAARFLCCFLSLSLAERVFAQVVDLQVLRRDHVRARDVEAVVHVAQRFVGAVVHAGHCRPRQPHHEAVHVVLPAPPSGGCVDGGTARGEGGRLQSGLGVRKKGSKWREVARLDQVL